MYYPKDFLDECPYKLWIIWKCYILPELKFLKELMSIKPVRVWCLSLLVFFKQGLSFNYVYVVDFMIY